MTKTIETKHVSRQKNTHAGTAARRRLLRVSAAAALAVGLVQARHVLAAEETWTNGSGDSMWNTTSSNWNLGNWSNGNDAVFGVTSVGTLTVASGISATYVTFNTAGYTLSGGTLALTGGVAVSGATADLLINANATIGTQITGASNVCTASSGTLTLTASNAYTGVTQVTNGSTLSISSLANINGNSSAYVAVQTGATLQYTGSGSETRVGTFYVNLGSATFNITQNAGHLTFNITGGTQSQALTKTGSGTLTLVDTDVLGLQGITPIVSAGTLELVEMYTSAVTYPASPTLLGGTLALSAGTTGTYIGESGTINGAAGTTFAVEGPGAVGNENLTANWTSNLASLSVASGASFDLRGNNVTVDALTGSGFIGNSYTPATLIVGKNGGSGTFSGVIAGNASGTQVGTATHYNINTSTVALTKVGSGVETLTASNTYSGGTTISAGTLRANNGPSNGSATGTGNITVAAGATLGGNGAVTGAVTLNAGTIKAVGGTSGTTLANGGLITAGSSTTTAGTLSTGNETWGAGTALAAKIVSITGSGNTVPVAGTDNDTISTGTISAAAITTSLPFDVQILSGGSAAANFQAAGANNYTFKLATFTSFTPPTGTPGFTFPSSGQVAVLATSGSGTNAPAVTAADANLFVLDTSSFNAANSGSSSGEFALELIGAGGTSGTLDAVYYSSAPEPGTTMLMAAGVGPLLLRRRRRASKNG